jgi:hypothetical protein
MSREHGDGVINGQGTYCDILKRRFSGNTEPVLGQSRQLWRFEKGGF